MSHFAQVIDGIVQQVIVAEQEFIDTLENPSQWIQTSYNTKGGVHYAPNSNNPDGGIALRANFAGIGYIYDSKNDVFYGQQPYPSWTLNNSTWLWEAPIPMPITDFNSVPIKVYSWDENTLNWIQI